MKYSEQRHKLHTKESSAEYCLSFKNSDNYFFAIENKNSDIIGTLTVYQDKPNRLFDIGILIGSADARGKGIGYEAWTAVMLWI